MKSQRQLAETIIEEDGLALQEFVSQLNQPDKRPTVRTRGEEPKLFEKAFRSNIICMGKEEEGDGEVIEFFSGL